MRIHREGHRLLLVLFIVLLLANTGIWLVVAVAWIGWLTAGLSLVIYLLVLQFFRHPQRQSPKGSHIVVAPADGKVVAIEEVVEEEYLNAPCRQISIFMSPFNVHVNRSPVEGIVRYVRYHAGKYLVAWHPKSSTENERTTVVIETPGQHFILLRQIAGALAKRIRCYVKEGEAVCVGQEFGFIKFGSRVDIFLPIDAEVCVGIGDKTRGGEDIIARLHSQGSES